MNGEDEEIDRQRVTLRPVGTTVGWRTVFYKSTPLCRFPLSVSYLFAVPLLPFGEDNLSSFAILGSKESLPGEGRSSKKRKQGAWRLKTFVRRETNVVNELSGQNGWNNFFSINTREEEYEGRTRTRRETNRGAREFSSDRETSSEWNNFCQRLIYIEEE